MTDHVIVPSRESDYGETTRLSRVATGKVYRKHVLSKGEFIHPVTGKRIKVDDEFLATIQRNFNDKVCPIVQVPLADKYNSHDESPDRNIGEVIDLEEKDGKLYAIIDARKEDMANELGKTILGASASLHLDYPDTRDGVRKGPTLLHVCATNRPYLVELDDYEEMIAATADSTGDVAVLTEVVPQVHKEPVVTVEEPVMPKTLEELLAELSKEHGVDVAALQAKTVELEAKLTKLPELEAQLAELPKLQAQLAELPDLRAKAEAGAASASLTNALTKALTDTGMVKLSAESAEETVSDEVMIGAVAELAHNHVALTARLDALEYERAAAKVRTLVTGGYILPTQEATMVKLSMEQPDVFQALLPAEPIVKLSHEVGVAPVADEGQKLDIDREIMRLTANNGPAAKYMKRP